jgi:hypothetical protein
MKRPEKLVLYVTPEKEQDATFMDWNGKECHNYCVHLPYWLVRAYNLDKHIASVKIEVSCEKKPMIEKSLEEEEGRKYYLRNWAKKYQKRRHNTLEYKRTNCPGFYPVKEEIKNVKNR